MIKFHELSDYTQGWVVGILEGEGCFTTSKGYPCVKVEMTDKDVIEHFSFVLQWPNKIYTRKRGDNKRSYELSVSGQQAKLFMLDVFPYMGERRQLRIQEIVIDG